MEPPINLGANYGVYFEGPNKYWGQGTKVYKMGTGEFVKDLAAPKEEVAPEVVVPEVVVPQEEVPEPPKEEPAAGTLTCKECQRTFAYSSEVTKKAAATRMKNHLKEHGINL